MNYSELPDSFYSWLWDIRGYTNDSHFHYQKQQYEYGISWEDYISSYSDKATQNCLNWFNKQEEIEKNNCLVEYKEYLRKEIDNSTYILNQIKELED